MTHSCTRSRCLVIFSAVSLSRCSIRCALFLVDRLWWFKYFSSAHYFRFVSVAFKFIQSVLIFFPPSLLKLSDLNIICSSLLHFFQMSRDCWSDLFHVEFINMVVVLYEWEYFCYILAFYPHICHLLYIKPSNLLWTSSLHCSLHYLNLLIRSAHCCLLDDGTRFCNLNYASQQVQLLWVICKGSAQFGFTFCRHNIYCDNEGLDSSF